MHHLRRILSDARHAIRLLVRAPAFAVTLLFVLSAGIGATTAMFSLVEALLLRPLPYERPEELTVLWKTYEPVAREWPTSIPDFEDWKAQGTTFSAMAATSYDAFSLSADGEPAEHIAGADVSGDFFRMFGVRALHGRLLGPDDDRVGGPRVCVLSAKVWRRRFGADPALVGRAVTLNGEPFTVVGIAPGGFRFAGPNSDYADAWVPLSVSRSYHRSASSRGDNFLSVMARRKSGVTLEQAQAQMSAVARNLRAKYPESHSHRDILLVDLHEALVGSSRSGLVVLFAAVALVFLVVCANVASLLVARGATRRGEMAARAALGATRARLVAQLLTESVVVFLLGGAGGAVVARFLVDFFASGVIQSAGVATVDVRVDGIALAFAVAISLACGLAFGLAPALSTARVSPQSVLKDSAAQAGVSRSQRAVRSALVVAQVALAFALLAGSGLAVRAFADVTRTSPGFDPEDLATARAVLPESKYADDDRAIGFYEGLLSRLAAQPGVEAVGANSTLPMSGWSSNGGFKLEGRPGWPDGRGPIVERNVVTPGYFAAMRIPVLRGRTFNDADDKAGRPVVIINQEAAERFFPGEDPIGRRIDLQDRKEGEWREIVGVVGSVRRRDLTTPAAAEAFVPLRQQPNRNMVVVARSLHAGAVLEQMGRIVATLDPEQALSSRQLMKARLAETMHSQRFLTMLLGAFAVAALVLSTMGLFGLVSYATSQRTRELGVRMALGASPGAVVALVLSGGARLVALGLGLGLIGAIGVGRALAGRVPGVATFDPLVFAAIPLVLGVTGLLACLVPAWRAVRIPPSAALRYE